MKYLTSVLLAAALLFSSVAYADNDHRDHRDRHVWQRGERGYNYNYGAPYYGEPYYGPYSEPRPGVGIQLPGVGIELGR